MLRPVRIAELFFDDRRSLCAETETFTRAEWTFESPAVQTCKADALRGVFEELPDRDKLRISLKFGGDPVSISSTEPDKIDAFLKEFDAYVRVLDSEVGIALTVAIIKTKIDGTISLYSLDTFCKTLKSKTTLEVLGVFAPIANSESMVSIEIPDSEPAFSTVTLSFATRVSDSIKPFPRAEFRTKRNDICHTETGELPFVPQDFQLTTRSPNSELNAIFDSLATLTSLIFLADVSSLSAEAERSRLSFKMNGYRVIACEVSMEDSQMSGGGDLYRVYEWVYSGGNLSDKIGLARNIISLHWTGESEELVTVGVFDSIRSGYEIYLKQNVQQYINAKNKLSEYLSSFSENAIKLANGLTERLEKNIGAFVAYFISSIIAGVLTNRDFTGVLTPTLAAIGFVILFFSLMHLVGSLIFFNRDKHKIEQDLDLLRARYADILDEKDLDRIFARAGAWERTVSDLQYRRKVLIGVWVVSVMVFAVLITCFTQWHSKTASLPAHTPPKSPDTNVTPIAPLPSSSGGILINTNAGVSTVSNQLILSGQPPGSNASVRP